MMPGQISATMPGLRPPIPSQIDMSTGAPPAKKMKPEENLIPEQVFLRQNPAQGNYLSRLIKWASLITCKTYAIKIYISTKNNEKSTKNYVNDIIDNN